MKPFGLYIHWPFCQSKCPYCDFNSHVRDTVDARRWQDALVAELTHCHYQMPKGQLKSIFFGGGTPSLMPPAVVEAVIDKAFQLWPASNSASIEITLEANPSSVESAKLQDFKHSGVNRLSIGIQSLRPSGLKFLGRRHSVDEALMALKSADKIFDRFSFDLIYARPQQTLDEWAAELQEALPFTKGHLSLYQLTIEKGTAFYQAHQRKDFILPDEETAARFYEMTQEITGQYNLPAYEISNHAQKGQESQHNLIYWRYESFGAVGPGAHGRYQGQDGRLYALKRLKAPETWLQAVERGGHGTDVCDPLSADDAFEECFMMGLRLIEGVAKKALESFDAPRLQRLRCSQVWKTLQQEGFVAETPTHIFGTLKGHLCLTTVTRLCLEI